LKNQSNSTSNKKKKCWQEKQCGVTFSLPLTTYYFYAFLHTFPKTPIFVTKVMLCFSAHTCKHSWNQIQISNSPSLQSHLITHFFFLMCFKDFSFNSSLSLPLSLSHTYFLYPILSDSSNFCLFLFQDQLLKLYCQIEVKYGRAFNTKLDTKVGDKG
jgi:hypothetical protein